MVVLEEKGWKKGSKQSYAAGVGTKENLYESYRKTSEGRWRWHIARDAFLSALDDPEFELKIREREPVDLDTACLLYTSPSPRD